MTILPPNGVVESFPQSCSDSREHVKSTQKNSWVNSILWEYPHMSIIFGMRFGTSSLDVHVLQFPKSVTKDGLDLHHFLAFFWLFGYLSINLTNTLGTRPHSASTSPTLGLDLKLQITSPLFVTSTKKLIYATNVPLYLGNHIIDGQPPISHYHKWFGLFVTSNCLPNSTKSHNKLSEHFLNSLSSFFKFSM